MKEQEVIVLQGLPGSGKTTYAKELCEKNTNWMRVNRDDIRNMLGRYKNFTKEREALVTEIEQFAVQQALLAKKNVVIDATNLNPKYSGWAQKIAGEFGITVQYKRFDTPVGECIKRDLARPNSVGEKVIRRMWLQYYVGVTPQETPEGSPEAVIFDVDGTLAHMTERGAYDWDKVSTDRVDEVVLEILNAYRAAGCKIIICTGRDGACHDITKKWLAENDVYYDEFFGRAAGDIRCDSIVKAEIYARDIAPKYAVKVVFDDRDRVVDTWRQFGLQCFQVADGSF